MFYIHYTMYYVVYILYTIHYILDAIYYMLYNILYYMLYTKYYVLCTMYYILYTNCSMLSTVTYTRPYLKTLLEPLKHPERPRAAPFRSKRIRRCMGVFALPRRRICILPQPGSSKIEHMNRKPYMPKTTAGKHQNKHATQPSQESAPSRVCDKQQRN